MNEYHWKSADTNDNDFDSQTDHIVGVNAPGSFIICASEGRSAMNTNVVLVVVVVIVVAVVIVVVVVVVVMQ